MLKIKVNEENRYAYIPKEFIEAGMVGDIDGVWDSTGLFLIRPGVTKEEAVNGLHRIIGHLEQEVLIGQRGNAG